MKNRPRQSSKLPAFQDGQIWELAESEIHIGMVGKRLVHYKHYRNAIKRAPVSLANQQALGDYLIAQKAVLVQGCSQPVEPRS
ncbi:MAG TPA: hypothetical protein VI454_15550 [Verrucomicrobiae bacterium]|jgi:hypothetical protein